MLTEHKSLEVTLMIIYKITFKHIHLIEELYLHIMKPPQETLPKKTEETLV